MQDVSESGTNARYDNNVGDRLQHACMVLMCVVELNPDAILREIYPLCLHKNPIIMLMTWDNAKLYNWSNPRFYSTQSRSENEHVYL